MYGLIDGNNEQLFNLENIESFKMNPIFSTLEAESTLKRITLGLILPAFFSKL